MFSVGAMIFDSDAELRTVRNAIMFGMVCYPWFFHVRLAITLLQVGGWAGLSTLREHVACAEACWAYCLLGQAGAKDFKRRYQLLQRVDRLILPQQLLEVCSGLPSLLGHSS